ncbi:glycosyltransferase [Acinetobacter baumannii]|uniref:glycosyltransferase family 2 protein n=1 Tax=Acinetobacter baumannii TaxID=470 RepID=UPI001F613FDE|nr:glycosyltransferase [Acinetobacter baumannii]MCI3939976.1 glycosyltransferase [Acinetobacter baumannii]
MKKLSIIIPIYNVEKYIVECLNSVVSQWNDCVEIVCIDDGSKDSSYDVVCKYVSELDSNIQKSIIIIKQENMGLSVTRNTGVKIASGEYIAFLDSDDKINPDFINSVLQVISNMDKPDIVEFNIEYSDGSEILICTGSNSLVDKFKTGNWYACGRVYKKNILLNKGFKAKIFYEDMWLIPQLYLKANKIYEINKSLYWYRYNSNGITHSREESNIIKSITSFQIILDTYKKLEMDDKLRSILLIHVLYISTIYIMKVKSLKEAIIFADKNFVGIKPHSLKDFNFKLISFIYFRKLYLLFYCKYKGIS